MKFQRVIFDLLFFLNLGIHFELSTAAFRVTCSTEYSKESFLRKGIAFVLTTYIEYSGVKTVGRARSKKSQNNEVPTPQTLNF